MFEKGQLLLTHSHMHSVLISFHIKSFSAFVIFFTRYMTLNYHRILLLVDFEVIFNYSLNVCTSIDKHPTE